MPDAVANNLPDDQPVSNAQLDLVLDKHLAMLSEHFDAVRIFAVRQQPNVEDTWCAVSRGRGNWYAQKSVIDDWVMQQNSRTKRDAFRDDSE